MFLCVSRMRFHLTYLTCMYRSTVGICVREKKKYCRLHILDDRSLSTFIHSTRVIYLLSFSYHSNNNRRSVFIHSCMFHLALTLLPR